MTAPASGQHAAKWDRKYTAAGEGLFGRGPNAALTGALAHPLVRAGGWPATALAIADGDGRNGTWLAEQGLAVTAVDFSRTGTEAALERDRRQGVTATRIVADVATWRPEPGQTFGLAALIYLQADPATRAAALRLARDALAPGGWLVMEVFAAPFDPATFDPAGIGPPEAAVRWTLAEVLEGLAGLTIVEALSGRISLAEGTGHAGEGDILRILARRP